jgi:hypothetical protein
MEMLDGRHDVHSCRFCAENIEKFGERYLGHQFDTLRGKLSKVWNMEQSEDED